MPAASHLISNQIGSFPAEGGFHILFAGPDRPRRSALAHRLMASGPFHVSQAGSANEALTLANSRSVRFEAIVLDIRLNRDGRELCARLRGLGVRVPIVVLDEEAREADTIRVLEAGANDVMPNPGRTAELAARLRAHIRQHRESEHAELMIGPYVFSPGKRTLSDAMTRRCIRLTHMEVGVLKCLHDAAGKPVSRDQLLRNVWNYKCDARSHTVETHIYRLRRKIKNDGVAVPLIANTRGGYRLGGRIDRADLAAERFQAA